ncbi:hypothetical protein F5882DRAFT_376763 [Hyaloscypha sp. PMI_1271]|nr:hypothetical protein F5882DRAFT_376763 [Hyaloscypha sp. PMI_1271]
MFHLFHIWDADPWYSKILANRPKRINTSGRTFSSNSRDGARAPQLLSNQQLDAINKKLLTAGESIELSRQKLFETRFVTSSTLQDLEQERQVQQRCSDTYKELHDQYGRNVTEIHEITTKCVSLHKELEESQNTLSDYGSSFEEFKRYATKNEDRISDLEKRRVETIKQIQVVIDRDNSARKRIDELEKERGDLIQEHREAISVRVARECLAEQRIGELQEGVDALIQEHQAAMNIAIDRMNSAEQKVEEFRKITSRSGHQEVASTCLTPSPEQSPGAVKRLRSETKQQGGRPFKHRKCKDATTMGEEDTIVVRI